MTWLMFTWTRKGKFSRVTYLADIRWQVPFDPTRAKPAQRRHC